MNKIVNIAIVGLGQVGIYLYNELRLKKKEIEIKTGKKINFSKDLTFEEFKSNLKVYVDNSNYPNIDE